MEEIDIIELFRRVKEGNAPKKIVIKNKVFQLVPNYEVRGLQYWYSAEDNMFTEYWLDTGEISTRTKIKILDKPIIEEIPEFGNIDEYKLAKKINEIIRYLKKEEK